MSENYDLRPATEAEYDFLWKVVETTMREYVAAIWGWDEEWQRRRFQNNFSKAEWQIIVAGGQNAGGLRFEHRLVDGDLFLANIHLLPEYQGGGIGSAIVRDLEAQANIASVPLTLNVLKSNPGALRLYERLGLLVVSENEERYFMSTGKT